MTDRRERVWDAVYDVLSPSVELVGPAYNQDWDGFVDAVADAAIAAMGLPTRADVEAAVDLAIDTAHRDKSMPADTGRIIAASSARQRLLDLIPCTEAE